MHLDEPTVKRRTSFSLATKEAQELASVVRESYRRVAESTEIDPTLEREAIEASRRRDTALSVVGRLVLEHLAAGGVVSLLPAEPVVPTVVAPPVVASPPPVVVAPRPTPPVVVPPPHRGSYVSPPSVAPPAPPVPPPARSIPFAVLAAYESPLEQLPTKDLQELKRLLATFPTPNLVRSGAHLDESIVRLTAACATTDAWLALPADVQRALTGYCAAYARYLQDRAMAVPAHEEDVGPTFSLLSSFSRTHRPGFVFGLARDQEPVKASWIEDARLWWSKLTGAMGGAPAAFVAPEPEPSRPVLNRERTLLTLAEAAKDGVADAIKAFTRDALEAGVAVTDPRLHRILAPHAEMLKSEPKFRALRKALRDAGAAVEEDDEEDADVVAWPHLDYTSGKRAIIVGGDPRNEVIDRVKEAFGFQTVEWPSFDPKRVQSLSTRVRKGSVDVVIFLVNFVNHSAQEILAPACRDAGATFALVPHGYGVTAIRHAIERTMVAAEAK